MLTSAPGNIFNRLASRPNAYRINWSVSHNKNAESWLDPDTNEVIIWLASRPNTMEPPLWGNAQWYEVITERANDVLRTDTEETVHFNFNFYNRIPESAIEITEYP